MSENDGASLSEWGENSVFERLFQTFSVSTLWAGGEDVVDGVDGKNLLKSQ